MNTLYQSHWSQPMSLHLYTVCVCSAMFNSFVTPMDCFPSSSSVHGIFQARILEWVAVSLPRGSSQPRGRTSDPSCLLHWILYHQCHLGSPTLTHYYHPKYVVYWYIPVHSWCAFCEFGEMYDMHQRILTTLKILHFLPIHPPPLPQPLAITDLFHYFHSFAFSSWNHIVCSPCRLAFPLTNICLTFLCVSLWLESSFSLGAE